MILVLIFKFFRGHERMESNVSADMKSKDDELESKKAQEVIGLLLNVNILK